VDQLTTSPPASDAGQPRLISLKTRSGLEITVPLARWTYRDEVTDVDLDFADLILLLSDDMLNSLQMVMVWSVERYAPTTLINLMGRLNAMFRALSMPEQARRTSLTASDLMSYHAQLGKLREFYFGTLRSFLIKWSTLGYAEITADAVEFVKELRVRTNPRGTAVATLDPKLGPFTTIEHEGLLSEFHDATADGRIGSAAYHLSLLLTYFGSRPIQFAALKTKDLVRDVTEAGIVSFKLMIPRAKRGGESARSEFTERKLTRVAGEPLWEYREHVEAEGWKRGLEAGEAPLFPDWSSHSQKGSAFLHHHSTDDLRKMFEEALRSIKVRSERTGKRLHVTPVRFRRTIATNAAIEGKDIQTIAAILDHSDTQTAKVYISILPEMLEQIDKAVALDLAPLAQAFKGTLIDSEKNATRGDDSSSRIIDLRIDRSGAGLGSCGQHSFCGFIAPIACYTCRNFEPWLDGPHARVLKTLLHRREQLKRLRDPKILEVNDRTILAVAEVIRLCSEKRNPKNEA